ncbi:GNAT family N-acetyltransferase [Nonomuraea soli]|uniref:GNAT superfamily N-acetyltransferase n=1 Tax=Nonomuraea soli TaxID=1032476 RepID=A0A7W0CR71_9ACTN|nr:GNAT family N-acetyltransferase [Nonomuraea soli]MBA2895685.1 GNAT superfamily N-acetyltransferase [Nonomuraea soli]
MITPFDVASADESDLVAHYEMARAAFAVDHPDAPELGYDDYVGRLRVSHPEVGEQRRWIARDSGRITGSAVLGLPPSENAASARVLVRVHPDLRGAGIGTGLLRAVVADLPHDRTLVTAGGITAGGDGERWAAGLGFTTVERVLLQVLDIRATDPKTWQAPCPPGYRLEEWTGSAPEALVETYARARNAIAAAPLGEASYRHPSWTVERVRQAEESFAGQGAESRVCVAVHEAGGEVAGFTELLSFPAIRDRAFQQDTAVVPGHRGRGLGLAVKSAVMRRLVAERPGFDRIMTNTDAANSFMIGVNHRLGYETRRTMLVVEIGADALRERLAR